MIPLERHIDQLQRWPRRGRHILAQYDDNSVIVYQAYKPSIGTWAIRHQRLGGPDFSYSRMSWIKPNFLWMMYRSGWGAKKDQEMTLALRLPRSFFDAILKDAVESSFSANIYKNREIWKNALETSDVRLQWDPDHGPQGKPEERRAIQLGLRNNYLKRMGEDVVLEIIDISELVSDQFKKMQSGNPGELKTPVEQVYVPADADVRDRLGLSEN